MKKKICYMLLIIFLASSSLLFFNFNSGFDVVIFSSMEDFRNDKLNEMLKQHFPNLKIDLQYIPSGNSAAKVKAEGTSVSADIVMDLENGNMQDLSENFCNIEGIVDVNLYRDEYIPDSKKYLPISKTSIGVIINTELLTEEDWPKTYDDLLDDKFKEKMMMPSPVASGTGYSFLRGIVHLKGEDAAFEYFDKFQKNIKQFTSSGSGPVNALVRGEASLGIGMVFQAVQEINKGAPLKVLCFEEGLPYILSGAAIIKGREANENIKSVYKFIEDDFLRYDKSYFLPENVFKEEIIVNVPNYPVYKNIALTPSTAEEKERLLSKWKY